MYNGLREVNLSFSYILSVLHSSGVILTQILRIHLSSFSSYLISCTIQFTSGGSTAISLKSEIFAQLAVLFYQGVSRLKLAFVHLLFCT